MEFVAFELYKLWSSNDKIMFSVILPFSWTSGVVLNFQGGIWVGFWKI